MSEEAQASSGSSASLSAVASEGGKASAGGGGSSSSADETVFAMPTTGSANVADLMAQDADDESLQKYKEQLLGAAARGDLGDTSDPRKVIVTQLVIVFDPSEGQADISHDLSSAEGVARLRSQGISIKEGAKYKFRISFRVQHEIVLGIRFVNCVTKLMFSNKEELMLGSYPPSSTPHTFEFPQWEYQEAPSGMMYRGTYGCKNSYFQGSDKSPFAEFEYNLNITRTWS